MSLEKVTIIRKGKLFTITRERKTNGESYTGTLEQCFNYVRAIYDDRGELKDGLVNKNEKAQKSTK